MRAFLKPTEVSSGRKRSASKNISVNAPSILPIIRRQPLYTGPVPSTPENPISEPLLFTTNSNLLPLWSDDATRPSLRVFLLRQVTLETRGRRRKSWRNQILGEAKLLNIPPLLAAGYSQDEIWKEDHLDWEGELRIDSRYDVGSWQAAGVHIKVSFSSWSSFWARKRDRVHRCSEPESWVLRPYPVEMWAEFCNLIMCSEKESALHYRILLPCLSCPKTSGHRLFLAFN